MDTYLHNEEMWVINVKLDRSEQILHSGVVCITTIYQVLVTPSNDNLRHTKFTTLSFLIINWFF